MIQVVIGIGVGLVLAGGAALAWFNRDEPQPEPQKPAIEQRIDAMEEAFGGLAASADVAVPRFEPEPAPRAEAPRPRTAEEWAARDAERAAEINGMFDAMAERYRQDPRVQAALEAQAQRAPRAEAAEPADVEAAIAELEEAHMGMLDALGGLGGD